MAIYDDFTLDYTLKTITHTSGTTVYTGNALYSWLQDEFDEQATMDDDIPITAATPTEYTLVNGWFIDEESTKYLKTGSMKSEGWTHPTNTTGIRMLSFGATYVNCISSDIGKVVVGGSTGDTANLLYFNNTTKKWWVRCVAADDLFDTAESVTITSGTGSGTTSGASASGEEIFSNIYSLGSIESGTDLYVIQDGIRIVSWWSSGHIDVLIRVKEAGSLINNGYLLVFARKWTDFYDVYSLDVSTGGRNAVPIATADDTQNQTATTTVANYNDITVTFVNGTLSYDGGSGTGLAVGKYLWDQTSNAVGSILAIDSLTAGTLTLGNVSGTFGNNNTISQLAELSFDAQTGLFTVGQTVTQAPSGATGVVRAVIQDPQAIGTVGKLYLSGVSGVFVNDQAITDPVTGAATANGTLTTAPTWTASVDGTLSSAHTINKNLQDGTGNQPYDVIVDCNGYTLVEVYEFLKYITRITSTWSLSRVVSGVITPVNGEEYRYAYDTYSASIVKSAPFGTMPGTSLFGARGIYFENIAEEDVNYFTVVDSNGVTHTPPNRQHVTVSAVESGDRVAVFLLDGVGGNINRNMCGGIAATTSGVDYLNVQSSIPLDLPTTGTLWAYDTSEGTTQIYTYTGYSGTQFTGLSPSTVTVYTTADTLIVPYVDTEATGTSIVVDIIYVTDRAILTRVRRKGILPFEVEGTITSIGANITAIRTVDGIVT